MRCAHLGGLAFCKLVYSLSAILWRHMSSTACTGDVWLPCAPSPKDHQVVYWQEGSHPILTRYSSSRLQDTGRFWCTAWTASCSRAQVFVSKSSGSLGLAAEKCSK